MAQPATRYSAVSILLHWGIALLVVTQIVLITLHEGAPEGAPDPYIGWHKSVGLSILTLTVLRLAWRAMNPAPPLPATTPPWQRILARTTQALFYVVLIAIPLTGWLASSAGGRDISWFGLFNWPLLPVGGGREAAGRFMDFHELGVKTLYVLLALHIAGALKHHFVDRDNVLHRMLPLIPRRP